VIFESRGKDRDFRQGSEEVFGSLMATLLLAVLEMVLVIISITMTP